MKRPRIVLTSIEIPTGGATIWNPKYRDMLLTAIEDDAQEDLQSYAAAGYNSFLFCRITSSIHIQKIEKIKSIEDVLLTDQYGLLR
jgi:hypothetical protein